MSFFTSVAEIDRMLADLPPVNGAIQNKVALRKVPIIDLKMRLGEASGAAVATLLVRAAWALIIA